jgi:hypothetical protein
MMTIEDYNLIIESKDAIIEKYSIIDNIFEEYKIDGYDMLINIIKSYKTHKCNNIPVEDTNEYKDIESISENPDDIDIEDTPEYKKDKRNTVYYDASENIKNDIIKDNSEIVKLTKIIEDNQINHKKEIDDLKSYYDGIISGLKKKEEVPLPSPSSSSESNKNLQSLQKNNFWNKNLSVLERCKVISYTYDKTLYSNDKELQILEYVSSIHKFIIKFNSDIANRFDENDNKMWEKIYNFKVFNGDIQDKPYNKKRVKYEYIRCNELYRIYGNNLTNFRIYTNYLGMLNKEEWSKYLEEFDILYKNCLKNKNLCTFILKKGNRKGQECGKLKCNMHS